MVDRLDIEQTIRQTYTPRDLYAITEDLSRKKEKGGLTWVEYEELMDLVKARFAELRAVKEATDA